MEYLSFIHGLACLVVAIPYLFTGISCSIIPPINCANDSDTRTLSCLMMKGSALFSVLYFTIIAIVHMYYGYYDGFVLPLSLVALMVLAFLLVSLGNRDEEPPKKELYFLLFIIFQALLLIKLSHTSYFIIDNKIHNQLPTSEIKGRVLTASLILELLQLLFWTLTPFLWYPGSK
ncbi:unnamed protein product, partial [Rotaria sp. Silwood2]